MARKRTVWLELKHPSKRTTLKKFRTSKKGTLAIKYDYYNSSHHFRTEALIKKIHRKKPRK